MNVNPPSVAGILFIAAAIFIMSYVQGCASAHDNGAVAGNTSNPVSSNQPTRNAPASFAGHDEKDNGVIGTAGRAIGDVIMFPLRAFDGNSS